MFQPGEQTIAVALLAELFAVNAPALFQHVPLERPQQVVRGVVEQFGLEGVAHRLVRGGLQRQDGDVSGQGDLKCIIQGVGTAGIVGPLTIGGRIADGKATLRLSSSRGLLSVILPLSAN